MFSMTTRTRNELSLDVHVRHVSTVTTSHCGCKICSYSSHYINYNIMHKILVHNISRDLPTKPLYLQTWVSESFDRLISVEHSNGHTRSLEVINLYPLLLSTILGCEHQLHLPTLSSHCHRCLWILAQKSRMQLRQKSVNAVSVVKQIRTALCWAIMQQGVVIPYWSLRATCRSHLQWSESKMLLRNYHYLLCNNPQQYSSQTALSYFARL